MKYLYTNKVSYGTIIMDVILLGYFLFVIVLGLLGKLSNGFIFVHTTLALLFIVFNVVTDVKNFSPTIVRRYRLTNQLINDIENYYKAIETTYPNVISLEQAKGFIDNLNHKTRVLIHNHMILKDKELYVYLSKVLVWEIRGNDVILPIGKLELEELG